MRLRDLFPRTTHEIYKIRRGWRSFRQTLGALLCAVGLHKRGNPAEITGDAYGLAIGDGPLRLATTSAVWRPESSRHELALATSEANYYVTKIETGRLNLGPARIRVETCVRCLRR